MSKRTDGRVTVADTTVAYSARWHVMPFGMINLRSSHMRGVQMDCRSRFDPADVDVRDGRTCPCGRFR